MEILIQTECNQLFRDMSDKTLEKTMYKLQSAYNRTHNPYGLCMLNRCKIEWCIRPWKKALNILKQQTKQN